MSLVGPSHEMLSTLQMDYLMWSAFVAGELKPVSVPLELSRKDWKAVSEITERFCALIQKTMQLCLERPELLEQWKFSPTLLRMLEAERNASKRELDFFGRFDVFQTPQGWKLSEFNTDVAGGIHEAAGLNALVVKNPKQFQVVELMTELACRDRVNPSIGIVYASGFGEDLEQCQYLRQSWQRLGIPVTLGSPANLSYDGKKLRLFDEPIDVLYRFFPAEWLEGIPQLESLLAAVKAGAVRMINPFSQLVAQSKKGMAFWWENLALFSADEQKLIRDHLPRTKFFKTESLENYLQRKDEIVVKRGFGRVGEQVLIGSMCSPEEWREELEWPLYEPDEWIVQDRFEVLPVSLEGETIYPCYGAYAVQGKFAGFYTRAAREPFISTDAYTLAVRPGE